MLWVAAVKSKDYSIPRSIAKRIIEKYGHFAYSTDSMDFLGDEISALNEDFETWLNGWTYSSNKSFLVKVIMLNLLLSEREPVMDGYKKDIVKINLCSALTYRLDPAKLQLDHLEANNLNPATPEKYYLPDDNEKRMKDVNGYLGNFMILDAADNNQKNNIPLRDALGFYSKIEKSWLVEDIKGMVTDSSFFDQEKKVPKEEFFAARTKQLKKYFKAFVNRRLDQTQIVVVLN